MDSGFLTPLVDSFKQDGVPREVKVMAAQGALAPRAHEQVALLALLATDPDAEIAQTADRTLQAMPAGQVAALLGDPSAPESLRAFFAARGIQPAGAVPATETDAPIVDVGDTPPPPPADEPEPSTLQRLAAMNIAQRMSVAMKGSREERAVLIRDPNKIVTAAVLSSPKLTETEVEGFAKMGSISEEVLRVIARNRSWMKRYGVVLALTKNAKTPVGLSMNLLQRLTEKDLRMLSTDRNVPEVLRTTARRKIVIVK
jgi:hypothetical protein